MSTFFDRLPHLETRYRNLTTSELIHQGFSDSDNELAYNLADKLNDALLIAEETEESHQVTIDELEEKINGLECMLEDIKYNDI